MLTDRVGRSIVPSVCVLLFDPLVLLFGMSLVLSPLFSSFHTFRSNSFADMVSPVPCRTADESKTQDDDVNDDGAGDDNGADGTDDYLA